MTDDTSQGYAEAADHTPTRQEVIYRDRDGKIRLLAIPGIPSIDDLVAIVRDARFHPGQFSGPDRPRLVT